MEREYREKADFDDFESTFNKKAWDASRQKHYQIIPHLLKYYSIVKHLDVSPKKALIWLRSKTVFVDSPASAALFNNLDDKTIEWRSRYEAPLANFSHTNANVVRLCDLYTSTRT